MGLAIDGNVVHGIARGGQAFLPITKNKDGSVVIDGHTYNDSLIGKRASGISSSTQYYLTGASDGWYFHESDNSVGLPDSGIIAEEFKADQWHVVAIKGNEAGGLLTTLGPGTDEGSGPNGNKNVAWFTVDSLKIS